MLRGTLEVSLGRSESFFQTTDGENPDLLKATQKRFQPAGLRGIHEINVDVVPGSEGTGWPPRALAMSSSKPTLS